MAKVTMPLMSVDASGKIAKTLVFFKWKGLDVVRSYAVPSNPRTTKQTIQRGYFTQAVDLFHSVNFNDNDRSAFNLAALNSKMNMSGFNWFVRKVVNNLVAGNSFTTLYNCNVSNITSSGATVTIKCNSDKTAKLYWGTSKTFMPNQVNGTFSNNTWTFTLSGLPSGSYIYFYVMNTASGEGGITGIYYFRTL